MLTPPGCNSRGFCVGGWISALQYYDVAGLYGLPETKVKQGARSHPLLPIEFRTPRDSLAIQVAANRHGGIHNRSLADLHPVGRQIRADPCKELLPQVVRFQEMPKLADRDLIEHELAARINHDELPHGP